MKKGTSSFPSVASFTVANVREIVYSEKTSEIILGYVSRKGPESKESFTQRHRVR